MVPGQTWRVDHIGIAVSDLDEAIAHYACTAHTTVTSRETIESQGVELAFLNTDGAKLELLAPSAPTSKIANFLNKRGPGLHHICYQVDDIVAELARQASLGCTLIDATPREGAGGTRIAFISPASFLGVLTELCEYPKR
jgi:methylmalonyl-CoA/ethylmalonyl-CoA epimerase